MVCVAVEPFILEVTGPMQDKTAALTSLLISAIHGVSPPHNLKDVLLSIQNDGLQDDLVWVGITKPSIPQ
jgi:hypothetical protein